jgi:hypothetical protein
MLWFAQERELQKALSAATIALKISSRNSRVAALQKRWDRLRAGPVTTEPILAEAWHEPRRATATWTRFARRSSVGTSTWSEGGIPAERNGRDTTSVPPADDSQETALGVYRALLDVSLLVSSGQTTDGAMKHRQSARTRRVQKS